MAYQMDDPQDIEPLDCEDDNSDWINWSINWQRNKSIWIQPL